MEVTDDASMVEGVNNIVKAQGRLEVLINNAGYGSYGAIEEVDMKEAKRQFEVNVFGYPTHPKICSPFLSPNKFQ